MSSRLSAMVLLSCCVLGGSAIGCNPGDSEVDLADEEVDALDPLAAPADSTAKALDPNKELARDWTRWAMALPWSTGPVNDPTGAECGAGQEGPVWFLAGTTGGAVTRECEIPAGKELFFPLLNRFCMYPPEWYPDKASIAEVTPDVLAWYEESYQHTCSLTLRVDGEDVISEGLEAMRQDLYVLIDHPYQVELNTEDNFLTRWGVAGGPMPATGDGHYGRLKPLSPGDHVLELGGSTCDGADVWFETAATYHLHVSE